jgi:hypothetical protein
MDVFVSKKLITLLSSSLFTVIVEVESALSSFVFPILIFLVITCTFADTHCRTLLGCSQVGIHSLLAADHPRRPTRLIAPHRGHSMHLWAVSP